MDKPTRSYKAGLSMARAIVEMVHLMYQNKTALHFLCGLCSILNKEIVRREIEKD